MMGGDFVDKNAAPIGSDRRRYGGVGCFASETARGPAADLQHGVRRRQPPPTNGTTYPELYPDGEREKTGATPTLDGRPTGRRGTPRNTIRVVGLRLVVVASMNPEAARAKPRCGRHKMTRAEQGRCVRMLGATIQIGTEYRRESGLSPANSVGRLFIFAGALGN